MYSLHSHRIWRGPSAVIHSRVHDVHPTRRGSAQDAKLFAVSSDMDSLRCQRS